MIWIVLLPVLGALINGVFLRPQNIKVAGSIGTAAVLGAFLLSVLAIAEHGNSTLVERAFTWIQAGGLTVPFALEYTPLTAIMLLVICGIGTLIHLYAIGYMEHEKSPWRFFAYLNLFVAAMLVLVLSSNLVGVFMGWEGVGLCSYLLIGYWFEDRNNATAGMKAFLTNRVGDLGFFIALFYVGASVGSFEISDIVAAVSNSAISPYVWTAVALGLFWASTGKSAQFPLYVWLPDAMAGPTPVSALIHAATMVTSGIFVSVRLWPVFATQPMVLEVMMWTGLITAWLAGAIALYQRDIKKVLAYSTVSQLGFMFFAVGAGAPHIGFFHVITHACFKALLFLGAGSVIHGMHHEQDAGEMGGLKQKMPITFWTFVLATAAIIGFPLTAGFFSKDLILYYGFQKGMLPFVLILGAALLTSFYMWRMTALVFWGKPRSQHAKEAHESPWIMTLPLVVLAVLSVVSGYIQMPHIFHVDLLKGWVESSWYGVKMPEEAHLSVVGEVLLILSTTSLSLGMAFFSWKRFRDANRVVDPENSFAKVLLGKFYVDEIYQRLIVGPLQWTAGLVTRLLDSSLINGFLHGLRDVAFLGSGLSMALQSGRVQTYIGFVLFGVVFLLGLAVWVFV